MRNSDSLRSMPPVMVSRRRLRPTLLLSPPPWPARPSAVGSPAAGLRGASAKLYFSGRFTGAWRLTHSPGTAQAVPPCSGAGAPPGSIAMHISTLRAASISAVPGSSGRAPCTTVRSKMPLRPNPSVKRSDNGGPPGPQGAVVYLAPRGPSVPPLSPAYLER